MCLTYGSEFIVRYQAPYLDTFVPRLKLVMPRALIPPNLECSASLPLCSNLPCSRPRGSLPKVTQLPHLPRMTIVCGCSYCNTGSSPFLRLLPAWCPSYVTVDPRICDYRLRMTCLPTLFSCSVNLMSGKVALFNLMALRISTLKQAEQALACFMSHRPLQHWSSGFPFLFYPAQTMLSQKPMPVALAGSESQCKCCEKDVCEVCLCTGAIVICRISVCAAGESPCKCCIEVEYPSPSPSPSCPSHLRPSHHEPSHHTHTSSACACHTPPFLPLCSSLFIPPLGARLSPQWPAQCPEAAARAGMKPVSALRPLGFTWPVLSLRSHDCGRVSVRHAHCDFKNSHCAPNMF